MSLLKRKQPVDNRATRVRPSSDIGSAPSAFSYHANRSVRPEIAGQSRGQKTTDDDKSDKGIRKWAFFILLAIILVAVLIETWVSTSAKVAIIEPPGFNYLPHSMSQYSTLASEAIGSSLYNQNKLTLSNSDVAQYLKSRYPEIAYAAVTLPFIGSTPTVHIQLVTPALIYSTRGFNYVLDGNGTIICPLSTLSPPEASVLPSVQSSYNGPLKAGDQVLTNSNVLFIRIVKAALAAKNIGVNKMVLVPGAEELDVYPAAVPYFVKFNLYNNDPLQQVGTYLATVATLKAKNQVPQQYIDVRVDGRAYYK